MPCKIYLLVDLDVNLALLSMAANQRWEFEEILYWDRLPPKVRREWRQSRLVDIDTYLKSNNFYKIFISYIIISEFKRLTIEEARLTFIRHEILYSSWKVRFRLQNSMQLCISELCAWSSDLSVGIMFYFFAARNRYFDGSFYTWSSKKKPWSVGQIQLKFWLFT